VLPSISEKKKIPPIPVTFGVASELGIEWAGFLFLSVISLGLRNKLLQPIVLIVIIAEVVYIFSWNCQIRNILTGIIIFLKIIECVVVK